MRLGRNDSALESIPLRLMIVAVVATMSVIPAARALGTLEDKQFMSRAAEQLERIIERAEGVAMMGPWNVATVELDFTSSGGLRLDRLVIGDAASGTNMSAVVLWLSSGGCIIRTCTEPPAWLRAQNGGALTVTGPSLVLRLSFQLESGIEYVLAEAL